MTLYDVTMMTVGPAKHTQALAALEKHFGKDADLLACWFSEIGALNRILMIRRAKDVGALIEQRQSILNSDNPLGLAELVADISMDLFAPFDFLPPMEPANLGPFYEVRSYTLKPNGLKPTEELWRKAIPARMKVSPVLTAMTSVTGPVIRFIHIWPYKSLDERARLRSKAIADGVWPPPGGPGFIATQQTDIYLPAEWSPLR